MKDSIEDEYRFSQLLRAGMRMRSPLHVAFLFAVTLLLLAFGAGLVFSLTERGNLPDIMLNHLSEADNKAQRGDYGGATVAYKRAAMVAPDDLQALLRLHRVASVNQDDETVWWALDRALRVAPRDLEVLMLAGDFYLQTTEYERAKQYYTSAIRLTPEYTDASYKLGYLHIQQGDLATARHWFEYTLAADAGHAGARQYMISIGSNIKP